MKILSLTFDLKNCTALIVIETGIRMFNVFAKSYPSSKKEGVPNNKRPTPKIDCTAIKAKIITNSIYAGISRLCITSLGCKLSLIMNQK